MRGVHDQMHQARRRDRETGARFDADVELIGMLAKPSPGALVEWFGPVGLSACASDVLDRGQLRLLHRTTLDAVVD